MVKTIVTTELITEIAKSFGVPVYNVLTGFKYIAEVVKRNEATGEFVRRRRELRLQRGRSCATRTLRSAR